VLSNVDTAQITKIYEYSLKEKIRQCLSDFAHVDLDAVTVSDIDRSSGASKLNATI